MAEQVKEAEFLKALFQASLDSVDSLIAQYGEQGAREQFLRILQSQLSGDTSDSGSSGDVTTFATCKYCEDQYRRTGDYNAYLNCLYNPPCTG